MPKWWSGLKGKIKVSLLIDSIAPISDDLESCRISPLFPLNPTLSIETIYNNSIYFFNFSNAYRVLGRIEQIGTESLKNAIFFSTGLSSIILISADNSLLTEINSISEQKEYALEHWIIKESLIENIECSFADLKTDDDDKVVIAEYKDLPITERALIDEFKVSIHLLLPKLKLHMPAELIKIKRLVEEMNFMIKENVYIETFIGEHPETLSEYTKDDLMDKKISTIIKHQNIDRIIQVNSALAYVSTQAFSGAIPILERRSIIRRNSLLGVGSAILALNNIARFIENCFSKVPFEEVIINGMSTAAPLPGLDKLYDYNAKKWRESSVEIFSYFKESHTSYFKLPYFNGRLGFRETEYSIAAAIQCLTSGASLEWSLMTVTHEMLHGHVRDIMKFIFYGSDDLNKEAQKSSFYSKFIQKINKIDQTENLIDSIRAIIFTYCCLTLTHGSLTLKKENKTNDFQMQLPKKDLMWTIFERENRNINEIFVHVLDLHYFYGSRISVYIPLIWCSWVSVPYVNGDLRQYILRSLLTISAKTEGTVFKRFNSSVSILKELLESYTDNKLNHPVIKEVLTILNNRKHLNKYYFPAFKASIIIVDMIDNIFTSEKIRAAIFNDENVAWENDDKVENSFEKTFKYKISNGFNDELIKSPVAYMLNKMIIALKSESDLFDLERETNLEFLALNSN